MTATTNECLNHGTVMVCAEITKKRLDALDIEHKEDIAKVFTRIETVDDNHTDKISAVNERIIPRWVFMVVISGVCGFGLLLLNGVNGATVENKTDIRAAVKTAQEFRYEVRHDLNLIMDKLDIPDNKRFRNGGNK